jgi:hypothetical protein
MVGRREEEVFEVLTRFYREVFLPDFERIVSRVMAEQDLRMNSHFAEMHRRFDRLERAIRLPGAERAEVVANCDHLEMP